MQMPDYDNLLRGKKENQSTPLEDNMLMATWLDATLCHQNENDVSQSFWFFLNSSDVYAQEKLLFFVNETLLEKKSINCHFDRKHNEMFLEKHIEFMCRKGRLNNANQDNSFILLDGDVKIYGLFDGHGQNGHQVSSFAQSKVLDFIRNK